MKGDFIPDAKTCLLLNKWINKAISWQTSQIYNTLSSVPWRDRRDKIVYSQKNTFCLASQPFKATSCGRQALYRVVLTVTLAAEGELWDNEVWSITRKQRGVRWGWGAFHFHIDTEASMWRALWSRQKATWYFVYMEKLKKTVSKRGRFCWGTYPPRVLLVPWLFARLYGFRT